MQLNILIIGRHEEILQTLKRIVNSHDQWHAKAAATDEEAVELFNNNPFDIVLLSSGISTQCENELRRLFIKQSPAVIIIQHYGGGSGLLQNEIFQALDLSSTEQLLRK